MGACGRRGIKQESAGYPEDQDDMLSQESLQEIDREIAKYPPDQTQSAVMAALRIAQDLGGSDAAGASLIIEGAA